jgi:hypothetical protein
MKGILILIPVVLIAQPIPLSIYEIQYTTDPSGNSPHVGDSVITTGIVTGIYGNNFYIEERPGGAWHGVYVYRSSVSSPYLNLGDSVTVTGMVQEYNNMTEIGATSSGAVVVISQGLPLPDTTPITISQLNTEEYEGSLVRIDSVYFLESGTFSSQPYLIVSYDGSDTGIVYIKSQTNIPGTPIPQGLCSIVGNVAQWHSNMELWPRSVDDFITGIEESPVSLNPVSPIRIYPNPTRRYISLSINLPKSCWIDISIYDKGGRVVKTLYRGFRRAGNYNFRWNAGKILPSGIYFVKVTSPEFEIKRSFVFLNSF